MRKTCTKVVPVLLLSGLFWSQIHPALADDFAHVPALIDIRTDSSDGAHTLEYIIKLAKKRGFDVLFINDHDRKVLEYGLRPFQNILKKRVEERSINRMGAENYLSRLRSASKENPGIVLIPGAESSPFYYWQGSYFKKNLTVCDWERHLLLVGLENPEDYKGLPILHNGYSTKYVFSSTPVFLLLLIPLALGLVMVKKPGILRYSGLAISTLCLFLLFNNHPFQSSPYDQYHGYQGILPYQLLIDYVNARGGMVFWNHPETKSGQGRLDAIFKETSPYPQVLKESADYTGFSALYGESITATEPGNIWDQVLNEYCQGRREKPAWGISAADFHQEGATGEKFGNYPTIFLVKNKTKEDILDALKKGRMYACRADVNFEWLNLEDFSVSDSESSRKGVMGEEISAQGFPRIKIRISAPGPGNGNSIVLRLTRSGNLLQTFSRGLPLHLNFTDEFFEPGKRIYYRLDAKDKKGKILVSNPIFVRFQK